MFWKNKDKAYYIKKGDTQYENKQFKKAIETYSKAIKLDNTDYHLFHKRGLAYGYLDEHENAIADYTTALRINPNFSKDYFNRSIRYSCINDYSSAIRDMSKYIELNPQDYDGYYMRGTYYVQTDDYDKAINEFLTSIKVSPNADAYCSLGTIYFEREDYNNALSNFVSAYKLDSKDVIICDYIGLTLYFLDRKDEAEKFLKEATNLNSTNDSTYFYLGLLCQRKSEFKDAIRYYLKAISINDNDYAPYCNVGLCYCAINECEKGITHLEKALRLNPKDSKLEENLKAAYDQLKIQNMPKCEDCIFCVNFADIRDYETKVKIKARGIPNDLCICSIRWESYNTGAWNSPYWEGGNPLVYLIKNSAISPKQVSCKNFEDKHTSTIGNHSNVILQNIIGNYNIIGNNNSQRF